MMCVNSYDPEPIAVVSPEHLDLLFGTNGFSPISPNSRNLYFPIFVGKALLYKKTHWVVSE